MCLPIDDSVDSKDTLDSRLPVTNTCRKVYQGLSLHHGNTESLKILEQKSFNWIHSLHTGLMNASHFTNLFTNSCDHISTNGKALLHSHINLQHPTIPLFALTEG